ncbi:MAG TPA: hypothetical protein VGG72_33560 [Bryobacteraceae bacterium]|jgi:hypothetical protein
MAAIAAVLGAGFLGAQSSPPATPPAPSATLNQLMRGLFFPLSNVIFLTQRDNPADIKRAPEPSTSSDPLTGVFGGWEAVQNSALILSDAADLLMTPGRKCSNGKDAPIANADWAQFVKQVREAGMVAYKAALTKDQDTLDKATDVLNTSCQNCHNKYRARTRCQ